MILQGCLNLIKRCFVINKKIKQKTKNITYPFNFTFIKVPLLLVMKSSYFGFGSPQHRLTCMQGQKHFNFLIICIYFYLICSMINFSKPLLCMTLICGDWSDWLISFKAVFVSTVLLCVQPLPGKQLFLMLQKQHLVAKNEFACSFRPRRKSSFPGSARATSGRAIC